MTKHLLTTKEQYAFQFTEEDRKKLCDFFTELTGLTNITKITIEPNGMYVEKAVFKKVEVKEETEND